MGLATLRKKLAVVTLAGAVMLVSACGSGQDTQSPGASTGPGSASAAAVQYDGPENTLPTSVPAPTTSTDAFTVGYMMDYSGVSFLVATADEAQAAVEKLGGSMILKDANLNAQTQVTQFYELLSQHVDAIIVHPVDPAALGPALKQAAAQDVPVIGMNATTAATDPLPDGYLETVNEALDVAAFSVAKRAAEQRPGGTVALMGTSIPIPTVQYSLTRLDYWCSRLGLTVLGRIDNSNDTPSGYAAAATTLVARYPTAQLVFAYNDPFALTVAQVLRASSASSDVLVSSSIGGAKDAFDAVEAGRIDSTYAIPWLAIGDQSVYAAYNALLDPGTKLPPVVNPHGTLVTSENVSSVPAVK
jgi:ribose transport system substrate-binding protein